MYARLDRIAIESIVCQIYQINRFIDGISKTAIKRVEK